MADFESPEETVSFQDMFGSREPGLTHPDTDGFIRLRDNGDIELVAGEGVSIIMNPRKRSITLAADTVKIVTKRNGLKWNRANFNERAVSFNEPTLLASDMEQASDAIYRDVDYFTNDFATLFSSTSLPAVLSQADEEIVMDAEDGYEVIAGDDVEGVPGPNQGEETEVDMPISAVTQQIFISPDGTRYRVKVNDEGNLVTELVS